MRKLIWILGAAALLAAFLGLAEAYRAAEASAVLASTPELPQMYIATQNARLPVEDELFQGRLVLLEDGQRREMQILIRERGNTSRRFPKRSYRVTIIDENGEKRNVSLGGLRSDDDWILNPMYTDTSKIREALAYELWDAMNASGQAAASSRIRHAEVYFNGEYWGLYGLQERIDRKQVNGSKRSSVLYKVATNDRPTVQELLACQSSEQCRAFELDFAGAGVTEPWKPAAAYMALLNGEAAHSGARLSVENVIDYGLWAMLTQAHDCHFKNQFLNCVYDTNGYTMYKIPWDLNNTLGDIWRNAAEDTNHTEFQIGSLVMDGMFETLLATGDPAFAQAVQARWQELRGGAIQEERLIARAHALFDPLFDAIDRDSVRWPQSGMGNGNARNIRDIEDFLLSILPRMDAYIARLGIETGE